MLNYIDYNLISENPKILCGYSDITALQNAIYAKTGLVTYSGPHFSTFGMLKGFNYTHKYFENCFFSEAPYAVQASKKWSDDAWYANQNKREFIDNPGFKVWNEGIAEGHIVGGNLCTLNLLQGTEFMPNLKGSILFLEDDDFAGSFTSVEVDRNLQSLIHLPDFNNVKAIILGRFQKKCNMSDNTTEKILSTKKELSSLPIISGVDFGHTAPYISFPIGGTAKIDAKVNSPKIEIIKH